MYLHGNGEELIYGGRILFSPHRVYNDPGCRKIPEL